MRRRLAWLLLAASFGCAGPIGPRYVEPSFAAPRDAREAETRLDFLEERLDAGRRHAQIWYWSWLAINGGGAAAGGISAATTDDGGDRAFNIVQASQAAIGLTDMLVLRPMPGRRGADPLREAAARGETLDARVQQGEEMLIESANRAEQSRDWRLHAANLALQAVGAGVLLALDEPGYAGLTMLLGLVGGEANFWSEPRRAIGDLDDYRKLVASGAVPGEPRTSWHLAPSPHGLALVLRY